LTDEKMAKVKTFYDEMRKKQQEGRGGQGGGQGRGGNQQ
jgi:hypothetical protein